MSVYFRTNRLDVRRLTRADVPAFSAYRADPVVARYQSWSDFDEDAGATLVESMAGIELGDPGEWFQLALEDRSRGVLVGDLACKVNPVEHREMEIGFTLVGAEQGRGYATEAVDCLLHHAFAALGMHRVVAITDARNTPAADLLTRVGMRQEAHFVENVFFKGEWGSELLFATLARENEPIGPSRRPTHHRKEHP